MRLFLLAALLFIVPNQSQAFCGFFVSGADSKLYNNASQVALMRKGNRTVMSMSNTYQGPLEDFAMVVPVPVILKKENVKTLPFDVFEKIDKLSAPRLVEYWEKDPCRVPKPKKLRSAMPRRALSGMAAGSRGRRANLGVKVEAEFVAGEYTVVILSAKEATGLETWLKINEYTIPDGASEALAPYISQGMKFFVAKVDAKKVKRDASGTVTLSPLRFDFESKELRLPVRLGLLNAKGKQDLIVYILHPKDRYEVANYKNIFIPSNLEVEDSVREQFGDFYTAIFDRALEEVGGKAIVTEYAWQTTNCDPCPVPPLKPSDMLSLGADILDPSDSATPGGRMRAQVSFVVAPTKPADLQFTAQKMMRRMSRGFDVCLSRQQRAATNSGMPIAPSKDLSGLGSMDLTVGPNGRVIEFKITGFPGLNAFGRQCFQRRAKRLRFPTQDMAVQLVVRGQIKMRRAPIPRMRRFGRQFSSWVLTRLHTRYAKDTLSEDLVFAPAKPIVGGRGSSGASTEKPGTVRTSSVNQFQGRYIIRNYWDGPVQCSNPLFGRWGGPPRNRGKKKAIAATGLANTKRGHIKLENLVRSPLPKWKLPGKPSPRR